MKKFAKKIAAVALAYALNSRKPVINLDPYTLTVSRIDKHADK